MNGSQSLVRYQIEDKPPLTRAVPLGLQHLLAMFLGNIAPPLIIAGALGLSGNQTTFLIQVALFISGLATLVQAYPFGPIGARMPVIMGTSFAFLSGAIAIGRQYGLGAVLGASLVACLVEVALGFGLVWLRRLFPPLVSGTVVLLIGLTLIPVGMDYAAGGVGAEDYGASHHLTIALLVLLCTVAFHQFARGFWSQASILLGALAGYLAAMTFGLVDFAGVSAAGWFSLPTPLATEMAFHPGAILTLAFLYLISAVETIGDLTGTAQAVGREPTTRELRGGLIADGAMSGLAALFGGFPNTSYSQNVGVIHFTGIASRHVTAISGFFLVVLGLVPKLSALLATIPPAVVGGGGLIMFAMIVISGFHIIHQRVAFTRTNMVILAVSLGLGLGVSSRPDALAGLPQAWQSFLGSGLVVGGLTALVLNLLLPHKSAPGGETPET